jgi:hypothetical protein
LGELTGPASKISPDTSVPSSTFIGTAPLRASSVAMPSPSTTVPARSTSIVRSIE